MITKSQVNRFAKKLSKATLPKVINLCGARFDVSEGHDFSINNQNGALQDDNLLGRTQEYLVKYKDSEIAISIQLYLNSSNYYRLFCYCTKGMIFSINLSLPKFFNGDTIELKQRISITTRYLSQPERRKNVLNTLTLCEREKLITDDPYVKVCDYNLRNNEFIKSSANKFLLNFMKITLIKGHFMMNKEYSIPEFDNEVDSENRVRLSTEDDAELTGYEGREREELRLHKWIERDRTFILKMKKKNKNIKYCEGCRLEPKIKYKVSAIDFLDLHHLTSLASRKADENSITEETDLAFLCPNCHKFIHKIMSKKRSEIITLRELKKELR